MTTIDQQCAKLTKEIRRFKDTKDETLEEQDINLREVKQFHKIIDEMLVDVTEQNAEIDQACSLGTSLEGLRSEFG